MSRHKAESKIFKNIRYKNAIQESKYMGGKERGSMQEKKIIIYKSETKIHARQREEKLKIIAKYVKDGEKYSIPEFSI